MAGAARPGPRSAKRAGLGCGKEITAAQYTASVSGGRVVGFPQMPAKTKHVQWPDWVEQLADPCLWETVREALVARGSAVKAGAERHASCRAALRAADQTLDAIADGRVIGQVACRKAAVAIRKYNTAAECAAPTARRNGR